MVIPMTELRTDKNKRNASVPVGGISREDRQSKIMTPKVRSTPHMRHHLPMGSQGSWGQEE